MTDEQIQRVAERIWPLYAFDSLSEAEPEEQESRIEAIIREELGQPAPEPDWEKAVGRVQIAAIEAYQDKTKDWVRLDRIMSKYANGVRSPELYAEMMGVTGT